MEQRLAPAAAYPNPTFPSGPTDTYAYNQSIANAPVLANSDAINSYILSYYQGHGTSNVNGPFDFGVNIGQGSAPINIVHGNDTSTWTKVNIFNGNGAITETVTVPIPQYVTLEGESYNPNPLPTGKPKASDSKLLIYDEDNNVLYELYQTSRPTEQWGPGYQNQNTLSQWYCGTLTKWNLSTDDYEWGRMTAGGLSYAMLESTPAQLSHNSDGSVNTNGTVGHALYFELPEPAWVGAWDSFPGLAESGGAGTSNPNVPYYGARLRLKASVDTSGLTPEQQVIANTLKTYGAYLTDTYGNGSNADIYGAGYALDSNNQNPLNWVQADPSGKGFPTFNLPMSDFEWVDMSPQITGISESSGKAGDTVTITGKNFASAVPITTIGTLNLTTPQHQQTALNSGTWAGAQIQVGSKNLTVTDLGLYLNSNITGTVTVELVNAATGQVVPGGSVAIDTSVGTAGNYLYAPLSTPVTLTAGQTYYLVSSVPAGSVNEWTVTTPPSATVAGPVYWSGSAWVPTSAANYEYGPVDLKYQIDEDSSGLSVLFGGTAANPNLATNVQVVNDTTITATVPAAPAGYGNVNVQVISGVAYSDTGWHTNINDPGGPASGAVFGYGFSRQYVPFSYGSGATQSVGPMAPPIIMDLKAQAGNGSVTLTWSAPYGTSSVSTNPAYVTYSVYRGTIGGFESSTPIATGLTSPTYTDTTVSNGTTYYYQVVAVDSINANPGYQYGSTQFYQSIRSNEVAVMPNPPAPVMDSSFEWDSTATDTFNGQPSELPGFSSNDWEQAAYSATTGTTYYPSPNWGGPGNIGFGYEGSGNPHNLSADHNGTIAGVWVPTTDNWAPNSNPFPNGGYDGNQVAWVDALTSGTTNYNYIVQQTNVTLQANTTYNLTVAVGARTDTAFGGYQIELLYGSVDPITGIVTGTLLNSTSSRQAPVAGGFGDVTVSYTTPGSGPMIGQNLLIVLATNPANNAYNPHTGVSAGNSQVQPQTDFDNVRLTTQSVSLTDQDINGSKPAGSASYNNGVWTVSGGGQGINGKGGTSDQFNFANESVSGNTTLIGELTSFTGTNYSSFAGLMLRNTTDAGSEFVDVLYMPGPSGVLMQWRSSTNGGAAQTSAIQVSKPSSTNPLWLKLVQNGSTFTAYESPDDTNWTTVGSTTVSLNSSILAGLAVSSEYQAPLATATFANVTIQPSGGPSASVMKAATTQDSTAAPNAAPLASSNSSLDTANLVSVANALRMPSNEPATSSSPLVGDPQRRSAPAALLASRSAHGRPGWFPTWQSLEEALLFGQEPSEG